MKAFQTKENFTQLILNKIDSENEWYKRFLENNPDGDEQRERDHRIILSVYTNLLHDIKGIF